MTREQLTAILTATRTEGFRTERGGVINWDLTDDGVELDVIAEATDPDDTEVVLTLTRAEAMELVNGLAAALLAGRE